METLRISSWSISCIINASLSNNNTSPYLFPCFTLILALSNSTPLFLCIYSTKNLINSPLYKSYILPKLNTVEGKGGLAGYSDFILFNSFLDTPLNFFLGQGIGNIFTSDQGNALAYTSARLLSEVGLFGLVILTLFFIKLLKYFNKQGLVLEAQIMGASLLSLFLSGHYIGIYGTMLFTGAMTGALRSNYEK